MGINNYPYLTGFLWGLNVKCSWQKVLKQTHYINTNDYWYCRWGKWGSGKLSDLLKVTWLEHAGAAEQVFALNHKVPRVFQLQHTFYPPWCTRSRRRPLIPWGSPRRAHHDPTQAKAATQKCESPWRFPWGMGWDAAEHHEPCPSPAMSSQWQGAAMKTQVAWQPAWSAEGWRKHQSMELWVRHMARIMEVSLVQR